MEGVNRIGEIRARLDAYAKERGWAPCDAADAEEDIDWRFDELAEDGYMDSFASLAAYAQTDLIYLLSEIERLEKYIESIMEWISAKDRLPKDASDVLCFTAQGEQLVASYEEEEWSSWTEDRSCSSDLDCGYWSASAVEHVTHWMPLPEPPKGDA